jgi:hypothetical protein
MAIFLAFMLRLDFFRILVKKLTLLLHLVRRLYHLYLFPRHAYLLALMSWLNFFRILDKKLTLLLVFRFFYILDADFSNSIFFRAMNIFLAFMP